MQVMETNVIIFQDLAVKLTRAINMGNEGGVVAVPCLPAQRHCPQRISV